MRRKRKNPIAPRKGAKIKVEPIHSLENIQLIRLMLQDKPRDVALFTLGINTNLRASDLLKLRVYQVRDIEAGGSIEISEKKTGKPRRLTLNRACVQAIRNLFKTESYHPGEHLFKSQKNGILTAWLMRLITLRSRSGKRPIVGDRTKYLTPDTRGHYSGIPIRKPIRERKKTEGDTHQAVAPHPLE